MVFYSLNYHWQQWRYSKAASKTPLKPLYELSPLTRRSTVWATRFLVVDCEMSGLDVNHCQLLSIGWVLIDKARIAHASSRHLLIHAERGAGDSTRIHGLHDASIAGARSAASALMLLIKQLPETVVVFHHAPLDIRFLQKTALDNFRCPLLLSYVDTMAIEQQRLNLQGGEGSLRLAKCRARYGLPVEQRQHNALADAQATAELLLAQVSYLGGPENVTLARLGLACWLPSL